MKKISRSMKTLAAGLGLAGFLALGSSLPAFAASSTPSVDITGGTLAGANAASFTDFGGITLGGGSPQSSTTTLSIDDVTDATGTGDGWNVTLSMTQLTDTAVGSTYTIPTSAITLTTPFTVAQVGTTGSDASGITQPVPSSALDSGSAVKLLSAPVNQGMGKYSFSGAVATLTIPADTYAATYQSDATVSLTTTP